MIEHLKVIIWYSLLIRNNPQKKKSAGLLDFNVHLTSKLEILKQLEKFKVIRSVKGEKRQEHDEEKLHHTGIKFGR